VPLGKPAIHREQTPIRIAITNRAESIVVGSNLGFSTARSAKIKDALIGTIKSRWLYSSARSASAKVLSRGRQPITSETAHRNANFPDGGILIIALPATLEKEDVEIRL
jgi:hypothetical protein